MRPNNSFKPTCFATQIEILSMNAQLDMRDAYYGGTLILAGYLLANNNASLVMRAFSGSAIEAIFAVVIFITTAKIEYK